MARIFAAMLAVLLLVGPQMVLGFEVFQDPTDTGVNPGTPLQLDPNSFMNLNIYFHHGTVLPDPNLACSGEVTGDEVCGWDIDIITTGDVTLVDFVPGLGTDIVFNLMASELLMNGGDAIAGEVGTHRIGTLSVSSGAADGTVEVVGNLWVTAELEAVAVPPTVLAQTAHAEVIPVLPKGGLTLLGALFLGTSGLVLRERLAKPV
jgi:hypothetical protein